MKKFTLSVLVLFACLFSVNAQDFVSTTPSNRNVVIEEFTGRNCGYCPDGHVVANQIVHNNPGRAWAVNVHAGSFSPTSYPNLNTTASTTILGGFGVSGFPAGAVNRSDYTALNRGQWASAANQQLGQAAECNVAGQVIINPATRLATVTVEVYYTADSDESSNYLTVVMLQDSIMGSQSGGQSNPEQWVNGQYCHMHILRDAITPVWGDEISPTTEGTLITRTYTYQIPEVIGTPNGVDVVIDHLAFLAYVTEGYKTPGNATRPILNANELSVLQGTSDAIYPYITEVAQSAGISCSHEKSFTAYITNGGLDELTSIMFEIEVEGQETIEYEWTGNLESYASTTIDFSLNIPFGSHNVNFNIVSANGEAFDFSKPTTATCDEWITIEEPAAEEELMIEIMQDKYGNQITWEILGSDLTVLASGGPYTMLTGGAQATQLHEETATIPAGECIKFVIYDNVGNGICCNYGEGYYKIFDGNGNLIVDGDGEFGSEASHIISVGEAVAAECITLDATDVTEHSAVLNGKFIAGSSSIAGFMIKLADATEWETYNATNIDGDVFTYEATDLVSGGTYVYKAFVGSEPAYGEEVTFMTVYDNVSEIEGISYMIFPNPVRNTLTVKGESMSRVVVYNSVGQMVKAIECDSDEVQFDVNDLQNGIYFINIMNNNGASTTSKVSVLH